MIKFSPSYQDMTGKWIEMDIDMEEFRIIRPVREVEPIFPTRIMLEVPEIFVEFEYDGFYETDNFFVFRDSGYFGLISDSFKTMRDVDRNGQYSGWIVRQNTSIPNCNWAISPKQDLLVPVSFVKVCISLFLIFRPTCTGSLIGTKIGRHRLIQHLVSSRERLPDDRIRMIRHGQEIRVVFPIELEATLSKKTMNFVLRLHSQELPLQTMIVMPAHLKKKLTWKEKVRMMLLLETEEIILLVVLVVTVT